MTPHLAGAPTLETERLVLRPPRGEDWTGWAAFATSKRAGYIGGPYSRQDAFRAWGHVIGQWVIRGFGMFVLERKSGGAPLGHTGHWFPEGWPEREIGWSIWSAEAEGKGYAFEAATAVVHHAFGALGWDTAVSYIDKDNERSIALAERLGAVHDDAAALPDRDWPPVMVYRHPHPAEV